MSLKQQWSPPRSPFPLKPLRVTCLGSNSHIKIYVSNAFSWQIQIKFCNWSLPTADATLGFRDAGRELAFEEVLLTMCRTTIIGWCRQLLIHSFGPLSVSTLHIESLSWHVVLEIEILDGRTTIDKRIEIDKGIWGRLSRPTIEKEVTEVDDLPLILHLFIGHVNWYTCSFLTIQDTKRPITWLFIYSSRMLKTTSDLPIAYLRLFEFHHPHLEKDTWDFSSVELRN